MWSNLVHVAAIVLLVPLGLNSPRGRALTLYGFLQALDWWDTPTNVDPATASDRSLLLIKPHMFEQCTAARVKRAEENCGGRGCRIVFVGDSITEALTGDWCYYGRPKPEERRAFEESAGARVGETLVLAGAGDQTHNTLWLLEAALPKLSPSPDVFSVMIGTNNLGVGGNGKSAAAVSSGVKAIVASIRAAHPRSRVLVQALMPRADEWVSVDGTPWQQKIAKVNAALPEMVTGLSDPLVHFKDCNDVFPFQDGLWQLLPVMDDLLHPNYHGYKAWFSCVLPAVDALLDA